MLRTTIAVFSGALLAQLTALSTQGSPDPAWTAAQRELLAHVRLVQVDDGTGRKLPTVLFEGVNVQVTNGAGSTASTNGLGNVLVGYAETNGASGRGGSHNVVLGQGNGYGSHGCLVSGGGNRVDAPDATVLSAGQCTVSDSPLSVVLASSQSSIAFGLADSVLSGDNVTIQNGVFSTIDAAWFSSIESSDYAHIDGGQSNSIFASNEASITGGEGHSIANAGITSIVGGLSHRAEAGTTGGVLVGGRDNVLLGDPGEPLANVLVGGRSNQAGRGDYGVVVGGELNAVTGDHAVVGGGRARTAVGAHDWVAGALFQDE